MDISERFRGCVLGGAIGDAYENTKANEKPEAIYYLFGKPEKRLPEWQITDDTQLTLATIDTIVDYGSFHAKDFALKFLDYYKKGKITGIGTSTLKAMRELEVGGHWYLVGRKGEYAAGNGAAMRIAPLGFEKGVIRSTIKDVCNITHQNDEAYVGALSVIVAIRGIINEEWNGHGNLLELIIDSIPDTRVRDRFIEINNLDCDLTKIGRLGNNGYVVNSVPLAIAYASQVKKIGLNDMYKGLISLGGDTDTNCSIAGQVSGALIGGDNIPDNLIKSLKELNEYEWISSTIDKYLKHKNWR